MLINSKLPDVGVTIFSRMTQLAIDHDACNLSQGFPDFDTASELIDLVEKYMRSGNNQYAPMQGIALLREQIAHKVAALYGAQVDFESEITITSGATEAIYAAITAAVHPGEEVILFEPAYDAYVPAITLNKGIPVFVKMKYPEYAIDWNEVKDVISDHTRMIILNSPHNPSGTVLSHRDLVTLQEIVHNTDIVILSDEVYEHIVFDGLRHESILRYPELFARSFVVSSFGKTYHTTGWKIGYCIAPKELSQEFRRIHQFLTFASHTPTQLAYAEFMAKDKNYLNLGAFYQRKRDLFLSLVHSSRFRALPCRGTYFQILDYSQISDEPDIDFAKRLTIENGVAAIPPSVFYDQQDDYKVLRFCFAKNEVTLKKAAQILCKI